MQYIMIFIFYQNVMKHLLNIAYDSIMLHRKRVRTQTKLFNKSGPFRRLLFNDVELYVAPASNITLTLPGFFIFTTPWWGYTQ